MTPILATASCSCCVAGSSNGDQIGSFLPKDVLQNKSSLLYFHKKHLTWSKNVKFFLFGKCQLNPRFCYIITAIFTLGSFLLIDLLCLFFLVDQFS